MHTHTHMHVITFGSSVIDTVFELLDIDDSIKYSINLEMLEFFLSFLSLYVEQGFHAFIIDRESPGSKLSVLALQLLSQTNVFILSLKVYN